MLSKISLPGLVSALACSPNGNFCAAAVAEKIYIWEVMLITPRSPRTCASAVCRLFC